MVLVTLSQTRHPVPNLPNRVLQGARVAGYRTYRGTPAAYRVTRLRRASGAGGSSCMGRPVARGLGALRERWYKEVREPLRAGRGSPSSLPVLGPDEFFADD